MKNIFRGQWILLLLLPWGAIIGSSSVSAQAILGEAMVKTTQANVRSSPSTQAEIIQKVQQGTKLELTGKRRDWFEVKIGENQKGWVFSGVIQMSETVFWQACLQEGTPEAIAEYLKKYEDGQFIPEAEAEMKKCKQHQALASQNLKDLEAYLDEYSDDDELGKEVAQALENKYFTSFTNNPSLDSGDKFLERFPNSIRRAAVQQILEPLRFEWVVKINSGEACKKYIEEYPQGLHREEVRTLLEPLLFNASKKEQTIESFEEYLAEFPQGKYGEEANQLLEQLYYQNAVKADFHTNFEKYLKRYPRGRFMEKATERLAWLKSQKAVVDVAYPKEVNPSPKMDSPYWEWKTVFSEKGGQVGYRLVGSGYILDAKGKHRVNQFSNRVSQKEIRVSAAGQASDDYWFSDISHIFCNGYAVLTWSGEDAAGNPIAIEVKVHLVHKGCPGPKKE